MKKILVIGIKGMAGHVIFQNLPRLGSYEMFGIARNIENSTHLFDLDVSNVSDLEKIIKSNDFDAVINCIGILNKDAEDNPEKAIWFNSYFPHLLEKITKNSKTKVIHISTDCVFNGKKGNYTEEDFKDGIGFYAQSKALGEINNDKDITIRTSIVGPEINQNGIGLFNWFMNQGENAQLKGYTHAFWSGVTTIELSKVIHDVIQKNITGLKEIAPSEKISKYDMLKLFNEIFKENQYQIEGYDGYQVDKSLVSIRTDYQYPVSDYRQMFSEMKDWIESGVQKYHY